MREIFFLHDIENHDEVPVSPDGMNEDSSGAGTSTNTSTRTERHFSNKVGPLTGTSIPTFPSLKDRTIQSKYRSFKNTMLERDHSKTVTIRQKPHT